MAKNKGICRNKKCSNPVSEFDEANALRLCDDHYKLWKRNKENRRAGNDSNLLIVFYVQIMPDDFVMQLHRF